MKPLTHHRETTMAEPIRVVDDLDVSSETETAEPLPTIMAYVPVSHTATDLGQRIVPELTLDFIYSLHSPNM